MKHVFQTSDARSRRMFMSQMASSLLGLSVVPTFSGVATAAMNSNISSGASKIGGKAKSVIYLFMSGGMSHLDTFDTKPGAETQGPVESIKTSADDVQISQYFPNMAKQMNHVAVINSLYSNQGAHAQGRYFMHTGYTMRGTIMHPDLGAWSAYHLGKNNNSLPANVKIGGNSAGLGGGFLESSYAALPIGNPEAGLQYSKLARGVTDVRFRKRLNRLKSMNRQFSSQYNNKQSRAYASMYDEAVKLMKSRDLETFDLSREQSELRDSYGRNPFGQACLLARRMVESGVRFIEVDDSGWDTHGDNFERVQEKGQVLDQALAALIADLERNGLLDSTLVVLATEFGRSPTIQVDRNLGRNHYPQAFSCLLAGGGIKGGLKYGATDEEGREVVEDMVTVPDFNATIATAMGIDVKKKVDSPSGRPFTVADDGEPVTELFV